MSAIFISHSSADNQAVADLANRLAQQDHHSVFLDFDPNNGIPAGKSWERTLYRKLRACRALIAWCTDDYLQSHWCFAEIALARMEGKPIFALLTDSLSPGRKLPSILTERQYIDLRSDEEEAYARLWRGLEDLDISGVVWDPKNPPYRGLNYYREQDAPVFFGRETETRAGLELVNRGAPNLMMVLGASGSGKSSLVRAGMLPRLRKDPQWLVVDPFRPRKDAFAELADALADAHLHHAPDQAQRTGNRGFLVEELRRWQAGPAAPAAPDSTPVPADERVSRLLDQLEDLNENPPAPVKARMVSFLDWTLDDLREICGQIRPGESPFGGATPLVDACDRLRRASANEDARVLLIIDQFEELLGHEEPDHPANRFLSLLRASVEADDCPLMVVGTMRSDFLGAFQRHPHLRGIDFESLSVASMEPGGMRRVIEEPAKLAALDLESGLPGRLLDDTETPDALPLLSFTLWVLWRDYREDGKLTIGEYEQLGGLDGAVSREADALLESAQRAFKSEPLRRAFVHMARLSDEGTYARRPVNWESEQLQPVHDILEQFVDRRLLVKRSGVVEVAHEALFRSWEPLKAWLDENRADLLLRQQISRDAAVWSADRANSRDTLWRGGRLQQAEDLLGREGLPAVEREFVEAGVSGRKRRHWTIGGAIVTALGIFAALAVFGVSKALIAEGALADVKEARDDAEDKADLAQKALAEANLSQGRLWLEKARDEPYPARQIMAAKAIGFDGFGRNSDWSTEMQEQHPVLLENQRVELAEARRLIESTGAMRFLPPVLVWSSAAGRHHAGPVTHLVRSGDGKTLVSASESDGVIKRWDLASGENGSSGEGKQIARIPANGQNRAFDLGFSRDETRILAVTSDGRLQSWDAQTGAPNPAVTLPFAADDPGPFHIKFSPGCGRIIAQSPDGTLHVCDAESLETVGEPIPAQTGEIAIEATSVSHDGSTIARLVPSKGAIEICKPESGISCIVTVGSLQAETLIKIGPDGRNLVVPRPSHSRRAKTNGR